MKDMSWNKFFSSAGHFQGFLKILYGGQTTVREDMEGELERLNHVNKMKEYTKNSKQQLDNPN